MEDYSIPFRRNSRVKVLADARSGIPFVARIMGPGEPLFPGDDFREGVVDRYKEWSVQFFDGRYDHHHLGQFTGGSYFLTTLLEDRDATQGRGLCLCGHEPAWNLSPATYDKFIEFIWNFQKEFDEQLEEMEEKYARRFAAYTGEGRFDTVPVEVPKA